MLFCFLNLITDSDFYPQNDKLKKIKIKGAGIIIGISQFMLSGMCPWGIFGELHVFNPDNLSCPFCSHQE